MELKDTLELSGVILGSLGGGAAIIFGFSSWLGKVWGNRLMAKEKAEHSQELESLRSRLTQELESLRSRLTQELESLRSRLTQDNESYKIKLKKSEFLFQKEFEAASEFITLKRSFLPIYSHPDMDWDEACDQIAHNLHEIEVALGDYLSKHEAVLKLDVKNTLNNSIRIAGENGFEITTQEVPRHINEAAKELFANLNKAEELLLHQVHSQSST